jgi:hypothetical protein
MANIDENTERNDYYNNLFAPHLFLDGSVDAGQDHDVWEALILDRIERESQIDLTLSNSLNGLQGTATARVISCADFSGSNLYIRFVITEDAIEYNAPNDKEIFYQVMRDFLPDTDGERITLASNERLEISRTYTISSGWNAENLNLVVFIQDDDSREILQAAALPFQE